MKKAPDARSNKPSEDRDKASNSRWLEHRLSAWTFSVLMLLLALAYTWPLAAGLGGSLLGAFGGYYGDVFGAIWELWATKHLLLNLHSNPLMVQMVAGPYASYLFSFAAFHKYLLVMTPLTALAGPVGAFNLFLILNYVLAGLAMYLLALELTGNRAASALAGILFAFNPYHYAHGIVHMDLASTWPMPLMILAILRLERDAGWRSWTLLAFSLVLFHVYCSFYYYIFLPLLLIAWLIILGVDRYVFDFSAWKRLRGALGRVPLSKRILAAAALLVLIAGAVLVYKIYLLPSASQVVRPLHWQERFKLSWANYLAPGVDHPLFGGITRAFVPVRRNVTESTAYIGWVALALGLWGFRLALRDRRAWMMLLLGLGGLSLTLGPYLELGALRLPMPALLLHSLAPFVRVISRYSIILQIAVTALAAYGAAGILRRLSGRWREYALGLLLLVAAVEYIRPSGVTAVAASTKQSPPIYAALASLEKGQTVFEYPATAMTGIIFADYQYFQTIHQKDLFNRLWDTTTIPPEYMPFWQDLDYPGALSDPYNVALLRFFGVEWLAFHDKSAGNPPSLPLPDMQLVEGLSLDKDFGADRLYRITAAPATVMLSFQTIPYYNYLEIQQQEGREGFMASQVLGPEGSRVGWRIMKERAGLVVRSLSDKPQRIAIRATAISFEKQRTLVLMDGNNQVSSTAVGVQPAVITLAELELAPRQVLELNLNTPEGVSQLKTASGPLAASVALSSVRVDHLE